MDHLQFLLGGLIFLKLFSGIILSYPESSATQNPAAILQHASTPQVTKMLVATKTPAKIYK